MSTPEKALVLKGISSRHMGEKNKPYDIYLTLLQLIRAFKVDNGNVLLEAIESVVNVQYVESRSDQRVQREERESGGENARIYAGVHFDLAFNPDTTFKPAHPIYHAQYQSDCIPPSATGRRYLENQPILRAAIPRIPTPPMDFGSVVYVILQDHFSEIVKEGWPPTVLPFVMDLPRLPTEAFTQSFVAKRDFNSTWWYG